MQSVLKNRRLAHEIASDSASIEILRTDRKLLFESQKKFARDATALATTESTLSSLEAVVDRQFERVTGTRLPPMQPLDMTGHLAQALKRGAQSNWRARNIFKGHQWRRRLRKIWLSLKDRRV